MIINHEFPQFQGLSRLCRTDPYDFYIFVCWSKLSFSTVQIYDVGQKKVSELSD